MMFNPLTLAKTPARCVSLFMMGHRHFTPGSSAVGGVKGSANPRHDSVRPLCPPHWYTSAWRRPAATSVVIFSTSW